MLKLRYLQTLTESAAEKNSTIFFQVPLDLIQMTRRGVGRTRIGFTLWTGCCGFCRT